MVFTAVLAAIAVIAAMVAVPGARAIAGDVGQLQADNDLGDSARKQPGYDESWGTLVWGGKPVVPEGTSFGQTGHPENSMGWGWCVDVPKPIPKEASSYKFDLANAGEAPIPNSPNITGASQEDIRDAAINVATKLKHAYSQAKSARANGDVEGEARAKAEASNLSYYLSMLIGDNSSAKLARKAAANPQLAEHDLVIKSFYYGYKGNLEEFKTLTGFDVEVNEPWRLQ